MFIWFINSVSRTHKANVAYKQQKAEEARLKAEIRKMRLQKTHDRLKNGNLPKNVKAVATSTGSDCDLCHGQDLYVGNSIMMCPKCKRNKTKIKHV